ncbi:MAG: LuxR C-terminal-related transcriptional regulator [Dysgonamonadaceae bacterium]|jgi:ATP/maltotriose-dependent transcriptional regulator MalT|nr:LuxR C-terminal-related transcriptional regulator [Dysgonamonadaceae bacterium]
MNITNYVTAAFGIKPALSGEFAQNFIAGTSNIGMVPRYYLSICAILVLILLAAIVYLLIALRRKKMQKELAEQQNRIQIQENEKLQRKVLATNMQINRKNELITRLTNRLGENEEHLELVNVVKSDQSLDKDYDSIKRLLLEINHDFYDRLIEKAAPKKLTHIDLKYSVFIYLGLTNKEISEILHVGHETVKVQKNKLKKKLNLNKEENLNNWIRNLA